MKRAGQPPRRRRKPQSGLGVEADTATEGPGAGNPTPSTQLSRLKLPHERDESTHPPRSRDGTTKQAADDVASGKKDTDCYNATGERFDRRQQR